jgi:hypothetical protein
LPFSFSSLSLFLPTPRFQFLSAILLDILTSTLINSYPTFCFHPKSFCLGFPEEIQGKEVFEMRWADGPEMEYQPHFLQRGWGFFILSAITSKEVVGSNGAR